MLKRHSLKLRIMLGLMSLLVMLSPITGLAWTSVEYTENWSEAEDFELGQPTTTIPPASKEIAVPPPGGSKASATPSLYIRLQIGSKDARVQDQDIVLGTAPITIDGHTMVPFRFLGDALKAEVGWEQSTRTVTLNLRNKSVKLVIGQDTALVNGKSVKLTTPAVIKEGSTLVPLRFVTENLDMFVNYTAATKTIEIADVPFEQPVTAPADSPATPAKPTEESTSNADDSGTLDYEKLYGTWYIWTAGSVTNLYDKTTGDYATHDYTQGADQGKVVINKDGTYSMSHAAWDKGTTVEGKWRLTYPNEMTIDRKISIVLLDGITDTNWNVNIADNGKIQLRYAMEWADGTVTWIHDSELYQKK